MSIESLNLSTSSLCPASCVFCPQERGTRDRGDMSLALVEKLMGEVTAPEFPWRIRTVQVGENGEAFMNPGFLGNLRAIRRALPRAKINLTTNLRFMRDVRAILEERVLDGLQLNIDGHNSETYRAQKGIAYPMVMSNLRKLLEIRAQVNPDFPVGITVLTLYDYCDRVMRRFNMLPIKAPKDIPLSSFEMVEASLRELDWLAHDVAIRKSPVFFWAERGLPVRFDPGRHQCPQLPRVLTEAFISPSGLWYPCCLDSNQDQAYGDVSEMTLREIHDSQERAQFIEKLTARQFADVGYPCDRVACCRGMR